MDSCYLAEDVYRSTSLSLRQGHNTFMITLDNVGFSYQDGADTAPVEALRNVSFTVADGEFVTLVGQSGAGKSTLLRMLAGLLQPVSGRIDRTHAEDGIGIVFQDANLMPWRTVEGNIRLPLEVKQTESPTSDAKIAGLIELVGLDGFQQSHPAQLSGGMAQRVALARALVHDPELLLLDEPFGALDALTRERMGEELLKIRQVHPVTFFMVTHSIEEAILLSDRILVLSQRPGTVIGNIPIEIARPRTSDMRYEPQFVSYVAQVRRLIGEFG